MHSSRSGNAVSVNNRFLMTFSSGGGDSTTATISEEASGGDPGAGAGSGCEASLSTDTPLLTMGARGLVTSGEAGGDMPPSYSGLLRGEVVINSSPPCYQVHGKTFLDAIASLEWIQQRDTTINIEQEKLLCVCVRLILWGKILYFVTIYKMPG